MARLWPRTRANWTPPTTSEQIGITATLQIGADKRHEVFTHELTAVDGTGFAGATKAMCHQDQVEDTTVSGSSTTRGFCTWRGGDGDPIFETYDVPRPTVLRDAELQDQHDLETNRVDHTLDSKHNNWGDRQLVELPGMNFVDFKHPQTKPAVALELRRIPTSMPRTGGC